MWLPRLACRLLCICVSFVLLKDLRSKYVNNYQTMRAPLVHLDDCAGMHYRLQLNCYRYMLETYYDVEVADMYVVCTHPDNGAEPFVDCFPVMDYEVSVLMAHQRSRVLSCDPSGGTARAHRTPNNSDDATWERRRNKRRNGVQAGIANSRPSVHRRLCCSHCRIV